MYIKYKTTFEADTRARRLCRRTGVLFVCKCVRFLYTRRTEKDFWDWKLNKSAVKRKMVFGGGSGEKKIEHNPAKNVYKLNFFLLNHAYIFFSLPFSFFNIIIILYKPQPEPHDRQVRDNGRVFTFSKIRYKICKPSFFLHFFILLLLSYYRFHFMHKTYYYKNI